VRPGAGLLIGVLLLAAGCRGPADEPEPGAIIPALHLQAIADDLRSGSCPPGTPAVPLPAITLSVTSVSLTGIEPAADLPGAGFAGGWHLTSSDPAFGGLSGLAARGDGGLLAVTDRGAFVAIDLAGGAPAAARLAPMNLGAGASRRARDAEGLALRDGLALVSFEHEHRVLAFDVERCGAAAGAVSVAAFGENVAGLKRRLAANSGAEGLALAPGGELLLALETHDAGLPLAELAVDGSARLLARLAPRGRPVLTGIDATEDTLYAVLRDYLPGVGNHIEVIALPFHRGKPDAGAARRVLQLAPRHGTDNFEGLAITTRGDGGLSLWLVADDNFSARQRTLLYAFELKGPTPPGPQATRAEASPQPSP